LAWLAAAEMDADPLGSKDGRDWAMRDYRTHLQTVLKRSHATVNDALAAVDDNPALFLNQRGGRLSVRGAHDIITGIASAAGLEDDTTAHVLRHTFATTLVRGGTDLVIVAELLGHSRLETTRGYTRSTAEDRTRALDLLVVDE
jgi:site-specific recombinase XerD